MLITFANVLGNTSIFVLVLPGSTPRLSGSLQGMLNQMTLTAGKSWWDNLVISVSFWTVDRESMDGREKLCEELPEHCINETIVARRVDDLLHQSCNTDRNFVFS